MIVDTAACIGPTHPWARVPALVVDAGQSRGTLWVDGALMPTLHIRISLQSRIAHTGGSPISFSALCIDSTGTWSARINNFWSYCSGWRSAATGKGVSNIALVADTNEIGRAHV